MNDDGTHERADMFQLHRFRNRFLSRLSVESKLFLVVTFVVTLVLAAFAIVDYEHEKNTLQILHQQLMQRGPGVLASATEEHQQHLAFIQAALVQTGRIHLIQWAITVTVLVLVLHLTVSRIVIRPTQQMMAGLNIIERGNWSPGLPVRSEDELGGLTRKLNKVGKVVSRRIEEWRSAERLAALALVSNSVSSELGQVSRAIQAAAHTLQSADDTYGPADYSEVSKGLEAEARRLQAFIAALDQEYSRALKSGRARPKVEERKQCS